MDDLIRIVELEKTEKFLNSRVVKFNMLAKKELKSGKRTLKHFFELFLFLFKHVRM